ncbi:hypothetical protein [Haliangium sp.]|uniref:hypothetical protein n=1 Tax=Haliangium sp. TaxID=2663208 RepID=UPI003D0A1C3F
MNLLAPVSRARSSQLAIQPIGLLTGLPIGLLTGLLTVLLAGPLGCGGPSKPEATGPETPEVAEAEPEEHTCASVIPHIMTVVERELETQLAALDPEQRAQAEEEIRAQVTEESLLAECEQEDPSQEELACLSTAENLDEMSRCSDDDDGAAVEGGIGSDAAGVEGGLTCADVVPHVLAVARRDIEKEMANQTEEEQAQTKQVLEEMNEDGLLAECEGEQPSQELLRCLLESETIEGFGACE